MVSSEDIGSVIQLVTFQVAATLQRCWSVRRQSLLNAFLVCTPDSTCLCPGRLEVNGGLEVNGRFRVGRVSENEWEESLGVEWEESLGVEWEESLGVEWEESLGVQWEESMGVQWEESLGVQWEESLGVQWEESLGVQWTECRRSLHVVDWEESVVEWVESPDIPLFPGAI